LEYAFGIGGMGRTLEIMHFGLVVMERA